MTSTPALSTTATPSVLSATEPTTPIDGEAELPYAEGMDDANEVVAQEPVSKESRLSRLEFLLEQSSVYSKILTEKMERQREEKAKSEARSATRKTNKEAKEAELAAGVGESSEVKVSTRRGGGDAAAAAEGSSSASKAAPKKGVPLSAKAQGKRKAEHVEEVKEETSKRTRGAATTTETAEPIKVVADGEQPALITGATMRDYQLQGLQWMVSLYENGLNGILADEMGLGKTIQTISFFAHLKSKGVWGPFMVVCPLSVLHNWSAEFEKFAPGIPVLQYHGTPAERQEIRRTRLTNPSDDASDTGTVGKGTTVKLVTKKQKRDALDLKKAVQNTKATFPIVITSYEIAMKDAPMLRGLKWKYIIVDEGHRLKNMDCKLIRELKSYSSANRLILTGTPLHNNLSELWSLLNFILPDIFDDLESFQQWFDLDTNIKADPAAASALLSSGESSGIVARLHAILKPFLLRRLKVDVEKSLPPKKEYLLHAPITKAQKVLYENVVNRTLRNYLIEKKIGGGIDGLDTIDVDETATAPSTMEETEVVAVEQGVGRLALRKKERQNYAVEENDDVYFDQLTEDYTNQDAQTSLDASFQAGKDFKDKAARKAVNNMHLQNVVMQLRKVASHPFLFDWPIDPLTGTEVINTDLVNASGKMLLLNRLLDELFRTGHKVLLFSQFTSMLDIIEDWAVEYKKLKICRIDGSTPQDRRRAQMAEFNSGGEEDGVCRLFLLSTRAGGLGINLVAADTVIFFDSDWNPQADLQAMDRAHRIGQTRPVLVFRLVTAYTIEDKILQRAGAKRKLEALVIADGKFKGDGAKEKKLSALEEAANLLRLEGEKIMLVDAGDKIISDEDLETLLDRSPAAFARVTGWKSEEEAVASSSSKKNAGTTFTVFENARDDVNDGLARMKE